MKTLPWNEVEGTVAFSVCGRWETEQRSVNKTRAGEVWVWRTLVRYQPGANEITALSSQFAFSGFCYLSDASKKISWQYLSLPCGQTEPGDRNVLSVPHRSLWLPSCVCCTLLKPGNQEDRCVSREYTRCLALPNTSKQFVFARETPVAPRNDSAHLFKILNWYVRSL